MKILTTIRTKLLDAGPKATLDVIDILKSEYVNIETDTVVNDSGRLAWHVKRFLQIVKSIFYKDIIIVQHPITQSKIIRLLPKNRTIILVHDLNSIRFPDGKNNDNEINNLRKFNYIIVHNNKMKQYLIEKGFEENKIFINELFDYICKEAEDKIDNLAVNNEYKVVFAGNLAKSDFIYQLEEEKMNFKLELYGQGLKEVKNSKLIYNGAFQSDLLPKEWKQNGIGLVWDGNYDESDSNTGMKNYTRYNNPHKLSCYIAAGIPVVVWEKAAIADFVKKYNIGYTINNIYEINNINFSDYMVKKNNVEELSKKVKTGYYTKKVISEVVEKINTNVLKK